MTQYELLLSLSERVRSAEILLPRVCGGGWVMSVSWTTVFGLGELLKPGTEVRDCARKSAKLVWLLRRSLVRHLANWSVFE